MQLSTQPSKQGRHKLLFPLVRQNGHVTMKSGLIPTLKALPCPAWAFRGGDRAVGSRDLGKYIFTEDAFRLIFSSFRPWHFLWALDSFSSLTVPCASLLHTPTFMMCVGQSLY